jgi:lipid II:glycine glycyltransferase (peptidoglycan interpeptide bridge formation enzyme)
MIVKELDKAQYVVESAKIAHHVLQSAPWGALKFPSWEPLRFGFYDENALRAVILVLTRKLPLIGKKFGYVPRGIALADVRDYDEVVGLLAKSICQENVAFLLIDPDVAFPEYFEFGEDYLATLRDVYTRSGFTACGNQVQPNRTIVLDLSKSEDELLSGMKSKHRQYIRKAQNNSITIHEGTTDDLSAFCRILSEISSMKGYILHADSYYKKVWEVFAESGSVKLFLASRGKEILGSYMLLFGKDTVYEMYGGSNSEGGNLRANYLLKWECIRYCKAKGIRFYDQWGAEEWYPGLVKFKEGFGGTVINYPSQYVYVHDKFAYTVYKLFERVNRIKQKVL